MYDICCIGHITLDKVVTPQTTIHMAGGTAWYFSYAIASTDASYLLVTALAASESDSLTHLQQLGIKVEALPSAYSVYFENIYGENTDERRQRVLQKAAPFSAEQIAEVNAGIFHLGPLLADDISIDMIKALSSKGRLSLDAQGYLRKVENQQVLAIDWPEKREALRYIDILKVNEHELEVLTDHTDIQTGARILADWGVKEVVVTLGSKGSVIYAEGNFYHIPAYTPARIVDATGCGDTYMAGYIACRIKGNNVEEAGNFASAMAAFKIENSGPFKGSEAKVWEMMKKVGYRRF